jgi:rhodanese-related sulfurtransferase
MMENGMIVKEMNQHSLYVGMEKHRVILVDVMAEEIHNHIHIEGSINIPFERLEYDAYRKLDPNDVIVTYSIDYECPVGRLAAQKLNKFGFPKTYYYSGGLKSWLEANLPVVKT